MTGSKNPTVSVLVVSYNTREITLACLRSVFDQAESRDYQVIVIDNCSSDGSSDAIAAEVPAVQLIRAEENLGFGRANNVAAKQATGDLLLLLNPDTLVLDKAIDRLVSFAAKHPEAGIWGGRTVFADGSLNPKSCWRFMSLWSLFAHSVGLAAIFPASETCNPESYGCWARDTVREVDFVAGCFLLIRRDLWTKLGGFDERFFMYAEEADLCYRARQLGARPLFTPAATIVHYGGASESVRAQMLKKLYAGRATYIRKHWSRPKAALGIGLMRLHVLTRTAGLAAFGHIRGSEEGKRQAREWHHLWRSRREWDSGYDRPSCSGEARELG